MDPGIDGCRRSTRALVVLVVTVLLGIAAWGLAACGGDGASTTTGSSPPAGPGVEVEVVRAGATRSAPSAPEADVTEVARDGTRFALALLQAARTPDANLVVSPYSLYTALCMTVAGARGETERQMLDALQVGLPAERLHPAMNSMALELQRASEASRVDSLSLTLRQAHSLWGQQGETYLHDFLDLLARDYGAGLRLVEDLSSEKARLAINDWVRAETEQRVPELLPPGALTKAAPVYLVLVDALTLSAPWKWPFPPGNTSPGDFHLPDGSVRTVPMMHQNMPYPYAEGSGYQAVELPYVGEEYGMVILLPAEGAFEEFAAGLDEARLDGIVAGLTEEAPPLTLPRFTVEWGGPLEEALGALGMRLAFDPGGADFSGMNGDGGIWVDDVYHAARVAVDEVGTEAAAGSAVLMTAGISEQEMVVDRPFLFLVRHRGTGAILFLGQVTDPAGN